MEVRYELPRPTLTHVHCVHAMQALQVLYMSCAAQYKTAVIHWISEVGLNFLPDSVNSVLK